MNKKNNINRKNISDEEVNELSKIINIIENKWLAHANLLTPSKFNIYHYYPYLFKQFFVGVDSDKMRKFTISARLFSDSIFLLDCVIDSESKNISHGFGEDILRYQAMQFESYHILYQLFTIDSFFWNRFQVYLLEYTTAVLEEKKIIENQLFLSTDVEKLSRKVILGKTGISRTVIAGLVELSGQENLYLPLVASMQHFYIARQICDDITDWKNDLSKSIYSTVLARLSNKYPDVFIQEIDSEFLNALTREFYYGGHAETLLEQAIAELHHATLAIEGLPQSGWHNAIVNLQNECVSIKNDITKIILKNLQRS